MFIANFPANEFKPPATEERLKAIGSTNALPPALQRTLDIKDFASLPAPGPLDWLAVHPEPGETFEEFRWSQPNRPGEQRFIIYLQPLGNFPEKQSPFNRSAPSVRRSSLPNGCEDFAASEYRVRRLYQPNQPHYKPATDSEP